MAHAGFVKKLCDKCGRVDSVRPRQRRCHARPMGALGWCCWGNLTRLEAAPKPKAAKRPQDVAAAKAEVARRHVKEKAAAIARLSKALRVWQRKATYYAERAAMSDAEIEALRIKARADRDARMERRKRRSITFKL